MLVKINDLDSYVIETYRQLEEHCLQFKTGTGNTQPSRIFILAGK